MTHDYDDLPEFTPESITKELVRAREELAKVPAQREALIAKLNDARLEIRLGKGLHRKADEIIARAETKEDAALYDLANLERLTREVTEILNDYSSAN